MSVTRTSGTAIREHLLRTIAAVVVIAAAIMPSLIAQSSSSAAGAVDRPRGVGGQDPGSAPDASSARSTRTPGGDPGRPRRDDARLSEVDGVLPNGVTVFDSEYPGVANLDADLGRALRDASAAAARDGIQLTLSSGWRSAAYQDQLLRDAVSEYGSMDEAARWVATAATSPHVAGKAVDIGSADGSAWLSTRGARFGLCQVYRNEPWHYELRPFAIRHGCPPLYADPTQDPRLDP